MKYLSHSAEETIQLGRIVGRSLSLGAILALEGDLGAGKTTFVKGLVEAVTSTPVEEVTSPTFTYLQIYEGIIPVYHFDLYRLLSYESFLEMGFDEFLYGNGVSCLEWSERLQGYLPSNIIRVRFSTLDLNTRSICVSSGKGSI